MPVSTVPADTLTAPDARRLLLACLPRDLQVPTTAITRIAAGMSTAGVYSVEAGDQQYVLKVTDQHETAAAWSSKLLVQQAAANGGIAPRVLHADENRRAVLSERIVDRSFPAQLGNPSTREPAIAALGVMLRKLHALPIPNDAEPANALGALNAIKGAIPANFVMPAFVRRAIDELTIEIAPTRTNALVMCHNDVNPTNLVFDGSRLMLLDWQTLAPNDSYYDLAAIAMFFRLNDSAVHQLISAHDGSPVDAIPESFNYYRRLAAILSGVAALNIARLRGHCGGDVAVDATLSLSDIYQQLRSGAFDISSTDGQWTFGLALVKEGTTAL